MGGAIAWGALTNLRSRMRRKGSPAETEPEPPLGKRYAHGEISTDEYGERRTPTGSAPPRS
jgi:hypothetical protein